MYRTVAQLLRSSEVGPFQVWENWIFEKWDFEKVGFFTFPGSGSGSEDQNPTFSNPTFSKSHFSKIQPSQTSNGPISEVRRSWATVWYMVESGIIRKCCYNRFGRCSETYFRFLFKIPLFSLYWTPEDTNFRNLLYSLSTKVFIPILHVNLIAAKPHCGYEMLTWISKKSSGLIEYIYIYIYTYRRLLCSLSEFLEVEHPRPYTFLTGIVMSPASTFRNI